MQMFRSGAILVALLASPTLAQTQPRLVPGFGTYFDIPEPFEKLDPQLRYKVVFDVAQPARKPDEVHQGLERVARMVNLLGRHGGTVHPGDIVVTLHGPAAKTALTAAAFAERFDGETNPNVELIRQLTLAGVSVRLCGQSMAANGFAHDEVNPDVQIDISAITTLASLQLQGYAVIQD